MKLKERTKIPHRAASTIHDRGRTWVLCTCGKLETPAWIKEHIDINARLDADQDIDGSKSIYVK